MKKIFKSWLSLLILLAVTLNLPVPGLASQIDTVTENTNVEENYIEENKNQKTLDVSKWTDSDFTYKEIEASLYIENNANKVNVKGAAIAGFSEDGLEKIKSNTHLTIPAQLEDGTKLVGVAKDAFNNSGITELTLPENTTNFLLQHGSFSNNKLENLVIPKGIVQVGSQTFFKNNLKRVIFSETVFYIGSQSFASNKLTEVIFPNSSVIPIQVDNWAFYDNNIKMVHLTSDIEKISDYAFVMNTGNDEKSPSTKFDCGVVWLYSKNPNDLTNDRIKSITKAGIAYTDFHRLVLEDEKEDTAWKSEDFTYEDTTITGLSEYGIEKRKANLNKLVLPDKTPSGEWITAIGDAKAGENGLFSIKEEVFESVLLPAKLETIGQFSFQNNKISELKFPETLQTIGNAAFQQNRITVIKLPNSLTSLGNGVFASQVDENGESTLSKVTLSKNLKVIPTSTFMTNKQNKNLKELEIPEGVVEIGNNAFSGAGLTSLKLPTSLEKIGNNAFSLHLLPKLSISENVTSIGSKAFSQCTDEGCRTLAELKLNPNLKTIGSNAFQNAGLQEVNLPKRLEKLPKNVFSNNEEVVKLYTGNNTHIEDKKNFPESDSHVIILSEIEDTEWTSDDFTYEGSKLMGYSEKGETKRKDLDNLTLPSKTPDGLDITEIVDNAFTIPKEELGSDRDGFVSPYGMKNVTFPEKLEKIGKEAFAYHNIKELTNLPETVTTIGENAFISNKLTNLVLPNSVISLGKGVFATNYLEEVVLSDNLTIIPDGAFSINRPLRSIIFPEGIVEIGEWAFNGCAFQTLKLPPNLQKVGEGAFYYHQVTELSIPGSLEVIPSKAFECTPKVLNLSRIELNEGIKVIESGAFRFGRLSELNLPNSLEKLSVDAFKDHTGYENSGIVRLNTKNITHVQDKVNFPESKTHEINYIGGSTEATEPTETTKPTEATEPTETTKPVETTGSIPTKENQQNTKTTVSKKSNDKVEKKLPKAGMVTTYTIFFGLSAIGVGSYFIKNKKD